MTAPRAFTVAVPACADEPGVRDALASLHASAARVGLSYDLIVGVNGPGEPSLAVEGARAFAAAAGLPLMRLDGTPSSLADVARPRVCVLRLTVQSKVAAWNAIREVVRTPLLVFADADVRVAVEAIGVLLRRLEEAPALAIAAGREVATLEPGDGLAARAAALPYRLDFATVPGRLYALRAAAVTEPIPDHVLHEDAYLTVLIGPERFVKERAAVVYLRPPSTWRDYLRQRVRCEIGKLQLAREFAVLYRRRGFGRYPWAGFVCEIAPREYLLVVVSLVVRVLGRAWALWEVRHGFPTGWQALPSTKAWSGVSARRTEAARLTESRGR